MQQRRSGGIEMLTGEGPFRPPGRERARSPGHEAMSGVQFVLCRWQGATPKRRRVSVLGIHTNCTLMFVLLLLLLMIFLFLRT